MYVLSMVNLLYYFNANSEIYLHIMLLRRIIIVFKIFYSLRTILSAKGGTYSWLAYEHWGGALSIYINSMWGVIYSKLRL